MIQEVRELEKENAVLKEKLNYIKQERAKEQEGTMKGYTNINNIYIKFKLMVLYILCCFIIILTR